MRYPLALQTAIPSGPRADRRPPAPLTTLPPRASGASTSIKGRAASATTPAIPTSSTPSQPATATAPSQGQGMRIKSAASAANALSSAQQHNARLDRGGSMTISGAAGTSGSRSGTPALGGTSTPIAGTPVKEDTNTAPKAQPAAGQSGTSAPVSSQPPTPRETAAEQGRDGRGRPDANGASRPPAPSQDSKPRGLLDRLGAAGGSAQPSNADVSIVSQTNVCRVSMSSELIRV